MPEHIDAALVIAELGYITNSPPPDAGGFNMQAKIAALDAMKTIRQLERELAEARKIADSVLWPGLVLLPDGLSLSETDHARIWSHIRAIYILARAYNWTPKRPVAQWDEGPNVRESDKLGREEIGALKVPVLRELAEAHREIERLRLFAGLVRDCPDEALHLMPIAAQAVLSDWGKTSGVADKCVQIVEGE